MIADRNPVVTVLQPAFRAFSALVPSGLPPGPMAQAFTFRAFGAGMLFSKNFHTMTVTEDCRSSDYSRSQQPDVRARRATAFQRRQFHIKSGRLHSTYRPEWQRQDKSLAYRLRLDDAGAR